MAWQATMAWQASHMAVHMHSLQSLKQSLQLLLGCSALRPNSAHLRFSRMYGILFIPAMRQRKE